MALPRPGEAIAEDAGRGRTPRESASSAADHAERTYVPSLLEAFDERPAAIVTADAAYAESFAVLFHGALLHKSSDGIHLVNPA